MTRGFIHQKGGPTALHLIIAWILPPEDRVRLGRYSQGSIVGRHFCSSVGCTFDSIYVAESTQSFTSLPGEDMVDGLQPAFSFRI